MPVRTTNGNIVVVGLVRNKVQEVYGPKARVLGSTGAIYTSDTIPFDGGPAGKAIPISELTIVKIQHDPSWVGRFQDAKLSKEIKEAVVAWETHVETPGDYAYIWVTVFSVLYGYV